MGDIGGPGCRRPVAQLKRWQCYDYGKKLWGHDAGMCGAAALAHAVNCVRGKSIALAYVKKLKELRPAIWNLSGMAETVRQLVAHLPSHVFARDELRNLKKDERREFTAYLHQWLSEQRRVFVVQFVQVGKANHSVCVDGHRRLIWDNKENIPLELNADSLRMCSGLKSRKIRVYVTEVMKQREKTKNTVLEVIDSE